MVGSEEFEVVGTRRQSEGCTRHEGTRAGRTVQGHQKRETLSERRTEKSHFGGTVWVVRETPRKGVEEPEGESSEVGVRPGGVVVVVCPRTGTVSPDRDAHFPVRESDLGSKELEGADTSSR